uniref:Neurogenic mastermind-like N-terminal domain-containing protein n=1 Tax=Dendroctonus ponderosae TaxID=77166 RepID=A0AAR5P2R0_DENPD
MGGNMNSIGQQMSGPQGGLAGMQNASTQPGMPSGTGMQGGPAGMQGTPPGMGGMMGWPNMGLSNVMGGHVDFYSMSQTQTINFTQQTLRRATGPTAMGGSMSGVKVPQMGPVGEPMAARMMSNQMMEQQKLQQILRLQQAMQQQQQQQLRPPPPDYKTSAGLGHGMQPRYGGPAPPPNMRRIPHQPIPPSGPMIRSQVYMMQQQQHQQQQQQQQMSGRATYARQAGPMGGMEAIQQNSDWRHVLMSQQQNANFIAGRPAYQGNGFNMNMGGPSMQQMTVLQHQQQQHLRAQQASMGAQQGGLGHMMGAQRGPMAQMNSMNQAMLHMQQQQQQQQQQQSMMQQQNLQMSMTNIHMQQSQSISVNNHSLSQPQQNMNNMLANSSVNSNAPGNSLATFNPQATDFTFEFLENLAGTADAAAFSDQEQLNYFDTDAAFNLDF